MSSRDVLTLNKTLIPEWFTQWMIKIFRDATSS
jgi:hypothetical protein